MNNTAQYRTGKGSNKLLILLMSLIAVIQVFPFVWLVFFSLKTNNEIFGDNPIGIPESFRWANYVQAWNNANIDQFFLNSVIVTVTSLVLILSLSTMTSFAIVRMKWRLSRITLGFILLGLMIPVFPVLLPLMLQFQKLGLYDSRWALILTYSAFQIPFATFIISGFFRGISKEIEEAACIDGAGIYRIFFSVMLPIVKPATATVIIFAFLDSWNEFVFANTFISSSANKTLTVGLMQLFGQYTTEWGPIGAGLVISFLPTLLLYLFFSKYVQESMAAGAVKG